MSTNTNPYSGEPFTPIFVPAYKVKPTRTLSPGGTITSSTTPSTARSTPALDGIPAWLDGSSDLSSPSASVKEFTKEHYNGMSQKHRR